MPRVIDGRLATRRIVNSSITHPKMADSAVDTAELVDATVKAAKLAASAVVSGKIADGAVTDPKLANLVQGENRVSVDSVAAYKTFPTAYSDTPLVTVCPADGVSWVRVTDVQPGSFEWVADVAGSASWLSRGPK